MTKAVVEDDGFCRGRVFPPVRFQCLIIRSGRFAWGINARRSLNRDWIEPVISLEDAGQKPGGRIRMREDWEEAMMGDQPMECTQLRIFNLVSTIYKVWYSIHGNSLKGRMMGTETCVSG
jgi:hypothetical protein